MRLLVSQEVGAPLLALTLRRVGYDYFMRLHDMSMLLTVGDVTGYCGGLGIASEQTTGSGGSPMVLGSPLRGAAAEQRPKLSASECRDLFHALDADEDGCVHGQVE